MSGLVNKMKFNEIKKKLEKQQQTNSSFGGEHEQQWKQGNTYKFRLLFPDLNDAPASSGPYFEKWTHGARNSDDKYKIVTCPTTFYNRTGFDKCPTCSTNSELWNTEVEADKEIARKFQRKFSGYALAYVVSDPVDEDAVGSVKVLRFGIREYNKLKGLTLGETVGKKKEEINPDTYIGYEAFSFDADGVDLIVEVSQSKANPKWNDYELSFARKSYAIEVDLDELFETKIKPVKYGEDIKEESEATLQKFFDECVLGHVPMDRLNGKDQTETGIDADMQDMLNDSANDSAPATAPVEKDEELSSAVEADINDEVNALLNEVNDVTEEPADETDDNDVADLLSSIEDQIAAE